MLGSCDMTLWARGPSAHDHLKLLPVFETGPHRPSEIFSEGQLLRKNMKDVS